MSLAHPALHTAPDLYILVRYHPSSDRPNYCRALCEFVDPDDQRKGDGLAVYMSPFDAHLDAAFMTAPGRQYHSIHAADFDPRELIQDNAGILHYFLHCGWAASDGKLVMRKSCGLAAIYGLESICVDSGSMDAIDLKISDTELSRYNQIRDRARVRKGEHFGFAVTMLLLSSGTQSSQL
ncbi:hypothetical protein [Cupriavidus sp. BIS7]|uniref:hypothetical protein n=1 Tax=Cupriavidus sp. BIS7 TaxID=1217718 RepID=UPI0003749214|nr:hypothetical protein [Cupriavidus sp. BIS7]